MHALLQPPAPGLPTPMPKLPSSAKVRPPYIDSDDLARHLHNMEQLAVEMQRPLHEIAPLYENTLLQLRRHAQVQDFLPILVAKGVRKALRSQVDVH